MLNKISNAMLKYHKDYKCIVDDKKTIITICPACHGDKFIQTNKISTCSICNGTGNIKQSKG